MLAKYLSGIKIEAICSSPLSRALRTAEIIDGCHKLGVSTVPGLIDFDYGEWQGLSHQEVKERYSELYTTWINHPEGVKMPGGESLDNARERAMAVVNDIINTYAGTAVLVSHRVVNKVLICALLGLYNASFWSIRQDTGGITSFTCEKGRFILTKHNDTSYLRGVHRATPGDF